MAQNEVVQWTIVGLLLIGAIVWMVVKAIRMARKRDTDCGCSGCGSSTDCKAKELRDEIRRRKSGNCCDGQSAKS